MRSFICLTALALSLRLTSAADNNPPAVAPDAAAGTISTNAPASATDMGFVVDDRHKLVPGDKLSFQILEDRHLPNFDNTRPGSSEVRDQSKSLVVADSGELDVPYVGRIIVSGKTCKEVAAELKIRLEKDYYYCATVVLGLDQASRVLGRVYVWGQVRNQGPVEIPANENFTAGKAILRAGGFGDFANKKKVKVVRNTKREDGTKQDFIINMVEVLEDGKTEKDVTLQTDDFIIVPARAINW